MSRTIFSPSALAGLVRAGDAARFGIDFAAERDLIFNSASELAMSGGIDLSTYSETRIRGKPCVTYSSYSTHLALRAISKHLLRRHRLKPPSRDRIVRGVVETLLDATPMFAIRRDITSFYESIAVDPIRDIVLYDTATPPLVRSYLQQYFDVHCANKTTGIPRGVGLSALFAEMSLQPFDAKIKEIPNVFKYYRFADDILIFSTSNDISDKIQSFLPETMSFNSLKSNTVEFRGNPKNKNSGPAAQSHVELDYLGYHFRSIYPKKTDDSQIVRVAISERKIKRIKSRIVRSFIYFSKYGNWALLDNRCKFISSNYRVRRVGADSVKESSYVYSGLFYNYKLCGNYFVRKGVLKAESYDADELKAVDGFYHSMINRALASGKLSPAQAKTLGRYSFNKGYSERIKSRFRGERVAEIKRIWSDV